MNTDSGAASGQVTPWMSVVILNYNGNVWLRRCLESLRAQTAFDQIEVIVADNASPDGSARLAEEVMAGWGERGRVVQNGANLGYCEGNNRGAAAARGRFLFFLNNDTWLEPDCLEKLRAGVEALGADAASPLVCNYEDDSFQTAGARGFDILGYMSTAPSTTASGPIFAAPGSALLVNAEAFRRVGGFDSAFFMYADEADLAWRLSLAGCKTATVPQARLHHRSAAAANPAGGTKVVEFRTNEMVRFYATRNSLLVLLKNTQHLLLLLAVFQFVWVLLESLAVLVLVRRWSTVRASYLRALGDCWRMRAHIRQERRRIRGFRRLNDLQMLRFFRVKLGRWGEITNLWSHGAPKVDTRRF